MKPKQETCTCGHPKERHFNMDGQCDKVFIGKDGEDYQCDCEDYTPKGAKNIGIRIPKGKESASEKEGGLGKIRTGTPSHGESLNTLPVAPSKPLEIDGEKLAEWLFKRDSMLWMPRPRYYYLLDAKEAIEYAKRK